MRKGLTISIILIVSILIALGIYTKAENNDTENETISINTKSILLNWQNNFGGSKDDYFNSTITTNDGYIIVGYSASVDIDGIENKGSNDAIIIKYSIDGNVLWQKSYSGSNDDRFNSVIEVDNSYISVGYSSSTDIEGMENKGSLDAIIVKYDSEGNIVWQKNYGGSGADYFNSIKKVDDGYIVVGYSNSTDIEGIENKGSSDAIIIKYDTDGNIVWQKNFGGNNDDIFKKVIVNLENEYIVVGNTKSTNISDFSKTNKYVYDAIIVKYDSEGNIIWQKHYGGSYNNSFNSIIEADNGYIVIGYSELKQIGEYANQGYTDGIMIKYNNQGDILWQKSWGGNALDSFSSIIEIDSNNYEYMISGYSSSTNIEGIENKSSLDAILLKIDSDGNILWKNNYGGNNRESFDSITKTSNGFLAVGYSNSTNITGIENKGSNDGIIVNYTMNNENNYTPDPTYECISDVKYKKTITYNSYNKGDIIEYNGENYYVIENSDDSTVYVTLLKANPLTIDELSKYGTDENNHLFVNEYAPNLNNPEKIIYEFSDGSGGMAYYTSETCGYGYELDISNYVSKDEVTTGCTSNYETSDVKKVVDAWANSNFGSTDLIEVDGYKARLITIDDMIFKLGYDLSGIQTIGYELKISEDVPDWAYNNNYTYWTMSEYMSSNSVVRVIESGESKSTDVYSEYAAVRPVVNVNKCILDGGCIEESVEVGTCDETTDNPDENDKNVINKKASEYLISKANDYTITSYDDGNESEMYKFFVNESNIIDYRYIGDNPNNYVYFNCTDDNNTDTCEVWRIIGVLETEDGNGKLERRLKIIKDSTKKAYAWNSTESNDWTVSSLNKYLNNTFYNNLSETAQSMIEDAKYSLGKLTNINSSASEIYKEERKEYSVSGVPDYWIGKVGLMYLSDYLYTYEYDVDSTCNQSITNCNNGYLSWIYNGNIVNQWTLTSYRYSSSYSNITPYSYAIYNDASVSKTTVTTKTDDNNLSIGIRPVVYLQSNIYITEGDGSIDRPYVLSLEISEDENEIEYDYKIGDSVTYNGSQYYVIKNSTSDEEYVTLIKALTLTADQINKYSNNEYKTSNGSIPFAVICNDTIEIDACVDSFEGNYENSFIKYIVDNWEADELTDEDLVEIDGYKSRLITIEELYNNLGYERIPGSDSIAATSDTLSIFKGSNLKSYWTMTKIFDDYYNNYNIYSVSNLVFKTNFSTSNYVKPVINLKKSAIDSVTHVTEDNKPSKDEEDDDSKELVCKEKLETLTRYSKYSIGDIVEYNGEKYTVIDNSGYNKKYLTLLKNDPLTADEIEKYNVNKEAIGSVFFAESTNVTYEDSTVKTIVDNWTINELDTNDLVEVNGYKSSILIFNDDNVFYNLGFYINTSTGKKISSYGTVTLDWLSYNNTEFWVYFDKNFYDNLYYKVVSEGSGIWTWSTDNIDANSEIKNYSATSTAAVRPVINLLKTAAGDKDTYNIGDEVEYKEETYHVISDSDENQNYVTLLKDKPLTHAQIYLYGDDSVKNNKVSYYSDNNCESDNFSECVVTYETSSVKVIVDSWANDNISDDLMEVDGYKSRLITTDELINNLGYTNYVIGSNSEKWYYTEDTPNSLYEVDGYFWTMNTVGDYNEASNAFVYSVKDYIGASSVSTNNLVRPVVNINKCSFDGGCIYDEVKVESCEYIDNTGEKIEDPLNPDDTPSESTSTVPVENTLKSPNHVVLVVSIVLVIIGAGIITCDYIKRKKQKNVNK